MAWITVELNNLHLFAKHGLYPEEKKIENEFEVNITLSFEAPEHPIHSIHETVNYVEVYRILEWEFREAKELLETCAMMVAQRIKEVYTFIKEIKVHIKKLHPPIENFSGAVSVSYTGSFE